MPGMQVETKALLNRKKGTCLLAQTKICYFLFAICYGLCRLSPSMRFFAQLLSLELLLGSGAPNYSPLPTL